MTKEEAQFLRSIGGIAGVQSMMAYSDRGNIDVTVKGESIDYDKMGNSVYNAFKKHGMTMQIGRREFGRVVEDIVKERGL